MLANSFIIKYFQKGDRFISPFCILALAGFFFIACEPNEKKAGKPYTGPTDITNNVEIKYSEQGLMKVFLKTPLQLHYQNNDKVFPDTINVDFYDPLGVTVITKLRADSGRFDQRQNVYIVKGNVRVVKSQTKELLTTTELTWSPDTRKVFTDKFVSVKNIVTKDVINGNGMDADQDFSHIKFRKGTFKMKFNDI
ncbi:LPS export ABC transporter periplasmic protein LptC [Dyadobacter subterraneus]|uniref:LPS export ABC transporter periplasmic protein LptC n=1 Tax=Dyadobacter subterraneus TaxID=2773304 RepID=A0ABR9WGS3_9BACT|nr:LPS export ABC transporter periplasmic protein LptC [Dyadobacter subterraneus]MBE9464334.1 LPS export ABC transporter periplasmic protein LptC [Dyadobacter subterraneus]